MADRSESARDLRRTNEGAESCQARIFLGGGFSYPPPTWTAAKPPGSLCSPALGPLPPPGMVSARSLTLLADSWS